MLMVTIIHDMVNMSANGGIFHMWNSWNLIYMILLTNELLKLWLSMGLLDMRQ